MARIAVTETPMDGSALFKLYPPYHHLREYKVFAAFGSYGYL
jgi:hypothetical protein